MATDSAVVQSLAADGAYDERPDLVSSSEAYARRFSGSVGSWFLEVQARLTLELLNSGATPLRILDVGGGHAQLVPALLAAGHQVVVLGSTAACGERLAPWLDSGRCRFEVGSLLRLPYPSRSFDVALSFRILSHLDRSEEFIAELCRVAGSSVILDYPSRRSVNLLARALFPLKLNVEGDTRRFRVFDPASLREAFGASGFRTVAERKQYFLPMAFHRLLGSVRLARSFEAAARTLGLVRAFGSPVIVRADRVNPAAAEPEAAMAQPPSASSS